MRVCVKAVRARKDGVLGKTGTPTSSLTITYYHLKVKVTRTVNGPSGHRRIGSRGRSGGSRSPRSHRTSMRWGGSASGVARLEKHGRSRRFRGKTELWLKLGPATARP